MRFTLFLTRYLAWHYSGGLKSYFITWGNLIWFAYNFFSIPLLLRTLFSPFERLNEEYKKGLDVGQIMSSLAVNAIMRCVGAVTRGVVIIVGALFLAVILAAGAALFIVWLMLPFFILTLLALGINGFMKLKG